MIGELDIGRAIDTGGIPHPSRSEVQCERSRRRRKAPILEPEKFRIPEFNERTDCEDRIADTLGIRQIRSLVPEFDRCDKQHRKRERRVNFAE